MQRLMGSLATAEKPCTVAEGYNEAVHLGCLVYLVCLVCLVFLVERY
jgi:hypothetical protein